MSIRDSAPGSTTLTAADLRAAYEALVKWGEARRQVRWGDWAGDSHVRCDDAREACARLADSLAAREAGRAGEAPPAEAVAVARQFADPAKRAAFNAPMLCPKCEGVDLAAEHGEHLRCSRCDGRGIVDPAPRARVPQPRIVCPACGGAKGVG